MKIYDTLILGSGYFSAGYAAACPNTVICEEKQICDTAFYLPLRSFRYRHYEPRTEEGKRLRRAFDSLSIFGEAEQNTNGFEFAFCRYLAEKKPPLLLKCRVIKRKQREDGIFDVTVQTNEGLSHLLSKRILDTANTSGERYFTVLFVCDDIKIEKVKDKLLAAFENAEIEPAFYEGRWALHMAARDTDENRIKVEVYEKWRTLDTDAKILYMAPVFYTRPCDGGPGDAHFENPIEAFEAGYFFAKEANA